MPHAHDKQLVALRVFESLCAGIPTKSGVEFLCTLVEEDEGIPEEFEYFALDVERVASQQFYMSELLAVSDVHESIINDSHKVQFMRERLEYVLSEPSEDVPSAHWTKIELSSGHIFFVGGLVTVETGGGVIDWSGAFLSVSDFYDALRRDGYLLGEEDLRGIPDERLLELWAAQEA